MPTTLPREGPWDGDRPWETTGVDSERNLAWRLYAGTLPLSLLLLWRTGRFFPKPFPARTWALVVAGAFLLSLLAFLPLLVRYLRFGRSRLRFERFPFLLGEPLRVALQEAGRLGGAYRLEIALRAYEGQKPWFLAVKGRRVVYEDVRTYDSLVDALGEAPHGLAGPAGPAGEDELALERPLPSEPRWSTRLAAAPCCYWELEVKAVMNWLDYRARFLLPVFARAVENPAAA